MRHAIAIDLGGTHASVGVVRERELLTTREIPVEAMRGLGELLPRLKTASVQLLQQLDLPLQDSLGVSLSMPSLVDFASGRVVSVNDKYPDAKEVDLRGWAREAFGLPLVLENDARAALLGEATAGAAQGWNDVLMMTLGTGVGSAVLIGGKPFRTQQPQGGNLGGHIPIRLDGRQCTCGAFGCVESEASGWALPLVARETPGYATSTLAKTDRLDFATLYAASDAGDHVAQQIVQHCVRVWSMGLVGLVHAYGPEVIVLGGGVSSRSELAPTIAEYVQRHAWAPAGPVPVFSAKLGNAAALYAAIPLLQESQSSPDHLG